MKRNQHRPCKPCVLFTLVLVGVMFLAPLGTGAQTSTLIGEWKLSRTEDPSDIRTIIFRKVGNRVAGTYINAAGEQAAISNIRLSGTDLRFTVPSLEMTTRLRKETPTLFRGRVMISGQKLPDEVQLVKK